MSKHFSVVVLFFKINVATTNRSQRIAVILQIGMCIVIVVIICIMITILIVRFINLFLILLLQFPFF